MAHSSLNTTVTNFRMLRLEDEALFFESSKLWKNESLEWFSFLYRGQKDFSFPQMVETYNNEQHSIQLQPGRVPATMLYAFNGDQQIIGRFQIRHELNDYLKKRGGHVGYAVATDFRQQGVASQMMKLGLQYCQEKLNLEKILITCADANTASWKLIEKFGGVLENKIWDDEDQEEIRRYWVTF